MKKNRIQKYEEVFTPGAPVSNERFMVGREQEKKDLRRILRRRGQHAIVIGDRGVGKTTIVKYILKQQQERPFSWYPASPKLTYDQVFRDLLENLGINLNQIERSCEKSIKGEIKASPMVVKVGAEGLKKTTTKYKLKGGEKLSPWSVFQYLKNNASDAIIVIDEYDAISSSDTKDEFHEGIAYTIKHLGDHSDDCNARIIVVGVAYSAEALLGPHESVRRNAKEIFLKPLRYSDIFDFIEEAEQYLNVTFEHKVKVRIARGSMGYPYFLHLIGQAAIDAMLARDKNARTVTWADFKVAVETAVEMEMRDAMAKFRSKSEDLTRLENTLLVELTWWKEYAADREKFVKAIVNKHEINERDINATLMNLTQDRKFIYLSRHKDDIRFRDPLMKAFLREKIYTERNMQKKHEFPKIHLPHV